MMCIDTFEKKYDIWVQHTGISWRVITERVSIAFSLKRNLRLDDRLAVINSGLSERKLRDKGTCSTKGRHLRSLLIDRY